MSNTQNNFNDEKGSALESDLQLDLDFCGINLKQEIFRDLSINNWNGKLSGTRKELEIGSNSAPQNLFENYLILNNPKDEGTLNYVRIDNDITFTCPKGITVETWVKLNRFDGSYYRIFDFGGDFSPKPNTIVNITMESSSPGSNVSERGGFTFFLRRKEGNDSRDDLGQPDPSRIYTVTTLPNSISLEQWTHLAAVANFEEKSAKFFVNGRLVGENRNVYSAEPYNRVELLRDNRIGASEGVGTRNGQPLDGGIAHLRLYSRPLFQEEILKRMAVKLFPTFDSSTLASVLLSLDPDKLKKKELTEALEKLRQDIIKLQQDRTWETLKVLFELKQR